METHEYIIEKWMQALIQKKELLQFFGNEFNYDEHIRRWALREGLDPDSNYTDIVFKLNFGNPVEESPDDSTLEP